ncbi:MAG TPA: DUF2470 domain-containing protein [Bryobacteraceae bacterium]|nr:DUF2470 domain-containing protein [Bryobacteraceae bacterium]
MGTVPEPSYGERSRTLVHLGRVGTLSTQSRKYPGFPFGSVMPYSPDERGRPVFLISSMAIHTQNLTGNPRASLLVMQPGVPGDPLAAARVTLLGEVSPVPEGELQGARERYLAQHEPARLWVGFGDFVFYRLQPAEVYFVGGFGAMGWVSGTEYSLAEPDPLAETAPAILAHMNADHTEALVLLAKVHGGVEAQTATVTAVDRLGFHLWVTHGERVSGVRVAFVREARSAAEARAVLVEMAHRAREV